jgi:hypothetical protein
VNTLFSWPFGIKTKVYIALRGIICIFWPFGTPKEEENVRKRLPVILPL